MISRQYFTVWLHACIAGTYFGILVLANKQRQSGKLLKSERTNILGHIDSPNASAAPKVQYPRRIRTVYGNGSFVQPATPGNLHYLVVDVHAVFLVLPRIAFVSRRRRQRFVNVQGKNIPHRTGTCTSPSGSRDIRVRFPRSSAARPVPIFGRRPKTRQYWAMRKIPAAAGEAARDADGAHSPVRGHGRH